MQCTPVVRWHAVGGRLLCEALHCPAAMAGRAARAWHVGGAPSQTGSCCGGASFRRASLTTIPRPALFAAWQVSASASTAAASAAAPQGRGGWAGDAAASEAAGGSSVRGGLVTAGGSSSELERMVDRCGGRGSEWIAMDRCGCQVAATAACCPLIPSNDITQAMISRRWSCCLVPALREPQPIPRGLLIRRHHARGARSHACKPPLPPVWVCVCCPPCRFALFCSTCAEAGGDVPMWRTHPNPLSAYDRVEAQAHTGPK